MRRLFRDRRGTVAIIAALSVIPLLVLAGLGTEVGTWYVIKRDAQNAADASALAGALALLSGGDVNSRVANVAGSNGFTDQKSPFANAIQSVPTPTVTASSVTTFVNQTQPMLLAPLLCIGQSSPCLVNSVTVSATATASIIQSTAVCMLGLNGNGVGVTIGGNQTLNNAGTNPCAIMSDTETTLNSAPSLTGSASPPAPPQLAAHAGCKSPQCPTGNYSQPVVYNPLTALDAPGAVPAGLGGAAPCPKNGCGTVTLQPGTYGDLSVGNGDVVTLNPGNYYFNSISMNGGTLYGANVNIVVNSGLSMTGGTATLTAGTGASVTPSILNGVLIYDRQSSGNVKINGNSTSQYNGILYFPNADVTWGGNATTALNCTDVVAGSLTMQGTSTINLDTDGCNQSLLPRMQIVLLTQ